MIEYEDFAKVDMRVGRIVAVEDFPEARKPAWKLRVGVAAGVGVGVTIGSGVGVGVDVGVGVGVGVVSD